MKYYRPNTVEQLKEYFQTIPADERVLLAGGTDIIPRLQQGREWPRHLIDVKDLPGLSGIKNVDNRIEIGALTTVEAIRKSGIIGNHTPALQSAAEQFAGIQIRNRATIGGNICNASPAGDLLPVLTAVDAELEIISLHGSRTVPVELFFTGPGKTMLDPDEIVQQIRIPTMPGTNSLFYKLGLRRSMAISVVNFALVYQLVDGGFSHLSIAAGSVAPTVVKLNALSRAVLDEPENQGVWVQAIQDEIHPITDLRASADYRRKALQNVLIFTIKEILERYDDR